MAKPLFAILRHKKLRTMAHVRVAGKHNDRTTPARHAKVGQDTRPMTLYGGSTWQSLTMAVGREIKALKKKPRANAVVAVEAILTASPEFFKTAGKDGWDTKTTQKWADIALEWVLKTHGDRVMQVTLHMDEISPHLHAVLIPEVDGRLCCREFTKRSRLQDLLTSYADACKPLGLVRGVARKGVKHTTLKEFYALAEEPLGVLSPRPTPPNLNAVQRMLPAGKLEMELYEKADKEWRIQTNKQRKQMEAKARLYDKSKDLHAKETELLLLKRELDEVKMKLDMQKAKLDGLEGLALRGKANFIKALPRQGLAQAIGIDLPGTTEVFDVIRKGGHAKTYEDAVELVLERLAALYPTPAPATPKKTFAPSPVPSVALEPLPTTPYPSTNFGM